MLKELIDYIKEVQTDSDIDNYLDSKYIHLTDAHYDQIAGATSQGELSLKKKPLSVQQKGSFCTFMEPYCT